MGAGFLYGGGAPRFAKACHRPRLILASLSCTSARANKALQLREPTRRPAASLPRGAGSASLAARSCRPLATCPTRSWLRRSFGPVSRRSLATVSFGRHRDLKPDTVARRGLTISIAPRMTPSKIFAYTKPPSTASSGSSTKSVRGLSSKMSENAGWGCVGGWAGWWTSVGVMERKDRKATWCCVRAG